MCRDVVELLPPLAQMDNEVPVRSVSKSLAAMTFTASGATFIGIAHEAAPQDRTPGGHLSDETLAFGKQGRKVELELHESTRCII